MNTAERTRERYGSRWGSVRSSGGWVSLGGRQVWWLSLLLILPSGGMTLAQQTSTSNAGLGSRPIRTAEPAIDQSLAGGMGNPIYQERRLRQFNAAQHKALVSDTDKLLKLVAELNQEIDNSSPAALTPDQLRMVAEIEKLARSVKDKMRNSVQGTPVFLDEPAGLPSSPSRR